MNETQAIDVASLANPFDFANPVSRKDLFIGRADERKAIEYYLDHTQRAERSINLALLGERAAGKTSLLNMIELEAIERDCIPVRIDLNESDVDTHFAFWFKVFDAILNRIMDATNKNGDDKLYGGFNGTTYDTYLNMITAYEVPADRTFCPFLFPIQFAKAMAAGNVAARVSDQILKRDLNAIAGEVGRPILLLIDECNILSAHRALLEMVRNTFMNLPGYMLVFTGTPDLFPVMDEVFSPIVRQFKRIEVKPFADILETRNAILEPLRSVGQEDLFSVPSEELIRAFKPQLPLHFAGDLQDLHDLTSGRPYEIQLVCHVMFRRVQQDSDTHMRLSFDVLEDVLRELRRSHDEDERPIISAVKSLDNKELLRLRLLLRSAGKVNITPLWFAGLTTNEISDELPAIREAFEQFISLGVLGEVSGCASFRGDEFDRIVCKYAARQRNIHLSFDAMPIARFFEQHVLLASTDFTPTPRRPRAKRGQSIFCVFSQRLDPEDRFQLVNAAWPGIGENWSVLDVCRHIPNLIPEIYDFFVEGKGNLEKGFALLRTCLQIA